MVGHLNREYEDRTKKYGFGKTKSTIFVNPDIMGIES